MFSQKVPIKLQKSRLLEALLVFSINPQKMQQKSWFQGVLGFEIETQKISARQLVNALNKSHWRPFTMDYNILHLRHK